MTNLVVGQFGIEARGLDALSKVLCCRYKDAAHSDDLRIECPKVLLGSVTERRLCCHHVVSIERSADSAIDLTTPLCLAIDQPIVAEVTLRSAVSVGPPGNRRPRNGFGTPELRVNPGEAEVEADVV